jgi:hypothetical protein
MADDLDNKSLTALCRYLLKEVYDLNNRLETTLLLLQHRRVFSDTEFSELLSKVKSDYDSGVRQVIVKVADAAQSAAIEKFLETFEGPKQ